MFLCWYVTSIYICKLRRYHVKLAKRFSVFTKTWPLSLLLNTNDLIRWEGERDLRMREYDSQRQKPSSNQDISQPTSSKLSGTNKTANNKARGKTENKLSRDRGEKRSRKESGTVSKRTRSRKNEEEKRTASKRIKTK